jgi:hypothetical protein
MFRGNMVTWSLSTLLVKSRQPMPLTRERGNDFYLL